jgi:hypothetical protein
MDIDTSQEGAEFESSFSLLCFLCYLLCDEISETAIFGDAVEKSGSRRR